MKPDIITDLAAPFKLIPLDFFRALGVAALALAASGCGSGGSSDAPAPPAETTVYTALVTADANRVRSGAGCVAAIDTLRSCIGFNNIAAPDFRLGPFEPAAEAGRPFLDRTGLDGGQVFAVAGPTIDAAAAGAFVQVADIQTFGIHVDTRTRVGNLSSVNPLYQFDRFPPAAGAADTRVFPWNGAFGSNVDVVLSMELRVRRLAAVAGSAAYGQAVMDWFDRTSGFHFYFLVQAFGTIPAPDNILVDGAGGNVIVATSFSGASGYGRNGGVAAQFTPAGFVSAETRGTGGHYEFRFGREEFARVLAAARTLNPALSANPADYMLDDYHFNNEVAGDGEIGMNLGAMTLRLIRNG